jgi:hypothetical protein
MSEEQFVAETDKSPGVLLASGYIAGGAIAGIVIAFLAGVLSDTDAKIQKWADVSNPFYAGPNADLLSLFPFALIAGFLYLVAREKVLRVSAPRVK